MTVIFHHVRTSTVVLVIWCCLVLVESELISKSRFTELTENGEKMDVVMDYIVEINRDHRCSSTETFHHVTVPIRTDRFAIVRQKADLISRFVMDYGANEAQPFVATLLKNIVQSDSQIYGSAMILSLKNQTHPNTISSHYTGAYRMPDTLMSTVSLVRNVESSTNNHVEDSGTEDNKPPPSSPGRNIKHYQYMPSHNNHPKKAPGLGAWTYPYFSCKYRRWVVTYMVPLKTTRSLTTSINKVVNESLLMGTFYIDIDISYLDINQCDVEFGPPHVNEAIEVGNKMSESNNSSSSSDDGDNQTYADIPQSQIAAFRTTHKCDSNTSVCVFTAGGGWARGSYTCECKRGYYSTTHNPVFNGTYVENAWKEKISINSATYSLVYVCKQCSDGCDNCTDGSPCLAEYNWPFRISLMTISVICVLLTILLMGYIYNYRKLKIIKVSSPIFLCMTLVGCVVMYLEMAAIFPILDMYSCIATKWTRHLGFCITYSALLLKTWRVSLTYRVKSAHKIKLTDKQLLQWLFPILLVMVIYLSTWTVSSPPTSIYIVDYNNLNFKQCTYDWWDHSLAIGEILFLLWGIRVCYTVRNAESFYNEAKHISYAIYNISVVNIIMVTIHLMIFPSAPPDFKYLFGFIRTQLSTTITILLVFGPKFYRVIKGQGDVYDNRARARGVTASFSLNGIGLVHEEPTDLYQENEELKEEIQKLASQIEFMKIVHMEMNNRHIKPKVGGYFSPSAVTSNQSPVGKAIYMKFDSSDTPTSRISPAAELISERV